MPSVYKIWCEWDMGFAEIYGSEEAAKEDIENVDWEELAEMTLEEVEEAGLISIEEIEYD